MPARSSSATSASATARKGSNTATRPPARRAATRARRTRALAIWRRPADARRQHVHEQRDRGLALDDDTDDVAPKPVMRGNTTKGNGSEDGIGTRITLGEARRKLRGPHGQLRPAFIPTLTDSDARAASKLGGTPNLRKGEAWPLCGNCDRAMPLFLQLDLDKVPSAVRGRFGGGFLQVFNCTNESGNCHETAKLHLSAGSRSATPHSHYRSRVAIPEADHEVARACRGEAMARARRPSAGRPRTRDRQGRLLVSRRR